MWELGRDYALYPAAIASSGGANYVLFPSNREPGVGWKTEVFMMRQPAP